MLLMVLLLTIQPVQQGATDATPDAALKAYQQAIEKGDVESFARLTLGPAGATMRTLAGPLKKAQTASASLSKVLAEKNDKLKLNNPFADDFQPLRDYHFELIELTGGKDEYLARIRFGNSTRLNEETVSVKKEGDGFRISLPNAFAKSVALLTQERLARQVSTLNTLSGILSDLADQISKGQLTSKEAILLKLANAVRDAKLGEVK